ncbi:MAG TPA: glycosyltransferase [Methylomirabilota bacterium]|nr:glycosyltransferase [Methylomirabilota bacterium]
MAAVKPGILFVSPWLHGGGIERVLEIKAPWFAGRGYRVEVASWEVSERLSDRPNPVLATLAAHGIRVRPLPARTPRLHLTQRALRVAALALARGHRILVGHETMANLVVILARRLLGPRVRAIGELHNAIVRDRPGLDPRTLERTRRLYRRADGLVAVSEAVRGDALDFFHVPPERVTTIYTPFRPDAIRAGARAAPAVLQSLGPFVVACGRLAPMKGFDDLIRAFARVRARSSLTLVILGEGPERPALRACAERLGVAEAVHMPGFVANPFPYFARARAFVLASRHGEALPRVLFEAMACGTPVIASRCRWGPEEILDHGAYGTLFDVGDVDALATAILEVVERPDPARRLARAAAARVEQYTVEAVLPKLESYYVGGAAAAS